MKEELKRSSMLDHLKQLRRVLIASLIAFAAATAACYFFLIDPLKSLFFGPLFSVGKNLVIIGVGEGFLVQLEIACVGGIVFASPVILWQLLGFIAPALYKRERKAFFGAFFTAVLLFAGGILFGYIIVLKFALQTFLIDYSQGFTPMISAGKYLSFFLNFLLPFGIAFLVPLATLLLSKLGIIKSKQLKKKRRYAALVILVFAAFLTPPDVLSQILLAGPMYLLYEASIKIAVLVERRKRLKAAAQAEEEKTA
jgi:sec-independent protein translocase protein TatC